jgi:hypothetical protein
LDLKGQLSANSVIQASEITAPQDLILLIMQHRISG